ncbi:uncharacterized protein LOC142239687 [Haematobia irritans]|uniref:uncharacterized protein LOC142239687 n=1 Tax=Haematobia irritans TaxID=7368 RepID=UPI003F4FFA86
MINTTYQSSTVNLSCMLSVLAKQESGLKVAHINAQSLNNKIDEFHNVFICAAVDVICVSETWFHPEILDTIYGLPGYSLMRSDRKSLGGGVAIFIKHGINYTLKLKSAYDSEIEFIFIELITEYRSKALIGCAYRPNNRVDFNFLLNEIERISLDYNDIMIIGDFNSNILRDNVLPDAMESLGLFSVNNSIPTHYTRTNNSLLDVIFTNQLSKVLLYDQLSAPAFSKHDLIFVTYNLNCEIKPSRIQYRDLRNIDMNLLQDYLLSVDWNEIYYLENVNEQLSFLQDNLYNIFDYCVPQKIKTTNKSNQPWFNHRIKRLIITRDTAYKRWKSFKTPDLHDIYKNARKDVVRAICAAKTSFYGQSLRMRSILNHNGKRFVVLASVNKIPKLNLTLILTN